MAESNDRSPALTYNIDDFIDMKFNDEVTFYNLSTMEKIGNVEHLDTNLVEEYLPELETQICELTDDDYKKYKYRPDLLAYYVYGSTQLDFIILMLNDMYDPKEFTKKRIKLPYASVLEEFIQYVTSTNEEYLEQNRELNGVEL